MSDADDRHPEDLDGGRSAPNLFELLRSRVRAASDGLLVVSAVLGVLGLVALGVARRWPWAAIAAFSVLLGAGSWGILDRMRQTPVVLGHSLPTPLISAARISAGAVALLATLALLLGAFGLCLGTWIS